MDKYLIGIIFCVICVVITNQFILVEPMTLSLVTLAGIVVVGGILLWLLTILIIRQDAKSLVASKTKAIPMTKPNGVFDGKEQCLQQTEGKLTGPKDILNWFGVNKKTKFYMSRAVIFEKGGYNKQRIRNLCDFGPSELIGVYSESICVSTTDGSKQSWFHFSESDELFVFDKCFIVKKALSTKEKRAYNENGQGHKWLIFGYEEAFYLTEHFSPDYHGYEVLYSSDGEAYALNEAFHSASENKEFSGKMLPIEQWVRISGTL